MAVPLTGARQPSGFLAGGMRRRMLGTGTILFLAAVLPALWLSFRPQSDEQRASDVAMTYARTYMVWSAGPVEQSTRIVTLNGLKQALRVQAPTLQHDLDAGGLRRQYGGSYRVAVVVLRGVFNSLPPDEGVTVSGNVLVLVAVPSERVLLLTR